MLHAPDSYTLVQRLRFNADLAVRLADQTADPNLPGGGVCYLRNMAEAMTEAADILERAN